MRPHSEYLHGLFFLDYLINQPVLNVYPARISAGKVANQWFILRWRSERVLFEDLDE